MFCGSEMSVDNIVGGGVALFLYLWKENAFGSMQ